MTIRQTTTNNYNEIYQLIQTAFETAHVSDGDEQDFAERLRGGTNYIPELDLVAEQDGELTGHIMLTRNCVEQPNGARSEFLMVAPLSVKLEYRGKGIGSALMYEGARLAKEMGFKALFLCGDPNYYQRFGYRQTTLYGIRHLAIPEQYVMAWELTPNALAGVTGIIELA